MPLPPFSYTAARTLGEASELLVRHGDDARLTAGGTDVLLHLRHGKAAPRLLVGLRRVPGLDRIEMNDAGLVIGAMARLAEVGAHPAVARCYPALRAAIAATATVQIRNMGTVVGNLCNASPSADTAPPLLAYDAVAVVFGPGGDRRVPLDRFFAGPGRTTIEPGEIVRCVEVPVPPPRSGSGLGRISQRSAVDIAAVIVAAALSLDGDGRCVQARLALGAVAPTPVRVREAETILLGEEPSDDVVAEAAAEAARRAAPISDVRAAADWRKEMVRVMAVEALHQARHP